MVINMIVLMVTMMMTMVIIDAYLPYTSSFGLLSLLLPTFLETMLRTNRCVPKARPHDTVKVPIPP